MKFEGRARANALDWLTLALVIIGGLNWGLIGTAHFLTDGGNWNVVDILLGGSPAVEALVYLLVGLAALYQLYFAYQLYNAGARTRRGEQAAMED